MVEAIPYYFRCQGCKYTFQEVKVNPAILLPWSVNPNHVNKNLLALTTDLCQVNRDALNEHFKNCDTGGRVELCPDVIH